VTALPLLIGLCALAVRVLLLLAGLLAAALLLAGFLTRVLVLLARVLVLVGHRDLPLLNATSWLNVAERNNPRLRDWFPGDLRFRRDHCVATACHDCGGRNPKGKLALYKPDLPHPALLPHRVPTC
jgi:hypothetical protein